jgi:CO/xanthine dehydrogenase Mo-binding subunit
MPAIGKSLPRKEGAEKVTGRALYTDDVTMPGMLHGVTIRSPIARGKIRNISFGAGIPWDQVVVVSAKDVPGRNRVALIVDDQPYLADEVVNHPEEPVLLLAHADKYLLEEARAAVRLEIEPLPAIFTIEESLAQREIVWGAENTFKSISVDKGDVESAWSHADLVVEGEYFTGAQEQLYIEPNVMLATADPQNGVTVWGSMQCPYYVHKALVGLFGLPAEKIRVVQMETGGGFGGKEEYPSMIAGHAALLAWKAGRPVKIIYDRAEDMAATTKRHPARTRHRTGVTHDGKLLAMDIEFVIDGGAYATLSSVVLSRGAIHAAGPYTCPNVRIRAKAMATNAPPHGAFRGFGAPQSIFALERHMDAVARRLALAPEEFRRRNFIRTGETLAVGQVVKENVDFNRLLDRALELSGYRAKLGRFAEQNRSSTVKRGIGLATFMHGAGFTGAGESYIGSVVAIEATAEGVVRVLAASTEIGQGTRTVFSQIVAETLGIETSRVEVAQPDTSQVPNSGPTVASRTAMIVGKLLESAAAALGRKLREGAGWNGDAASFAAACGSYIERQGALKTSAEYRVPPGLSWDEQNYRGDAYGTYAWAVYVAEVSVDTATCEIAVEDFVAVQEVGRVINPVLATGQIEGGVAQGIGYALYENVVWCEGRMVNSQMTNYIVPTSADLPPIRVFFEESPYLYGPGGAKGIGELPIDGPAPAIVNAIENATGISVNRLPVTPEVLMEAMEAALVTA